MLDPAAIYRFLLRIYPARFREEYQTPMERQFRDEYREAATNRERARLWTRAIADLMISAPGEIARELRQDLHYSIRIHRRRPLPALLAVAAMAMSIGAGTGVFSVLHALLLRGLPFRDPQSLVEISGAPRGAMDGREQFVTWARESSYLAGAATFSASEMNLGGGREALRVKVAETSSNFFDVFGTGIRFGRGFSIGEDAPAKAHVAVISHALWQQLYGANPNALGSALTLNGARMTIVGVAPPLFDYPGRTSVWIPTVFAFETIPKRGAFVFQSVGRLKPEITLAQARERLLAGAQSRSASLTPIRDQIAGEVRRPAWVLGGLVLFILIAACANLALLLISRATERSGELALRSALGASRARLVQQLMTESVALTTAGALAGLVIAQWITQLAVRVLPAPLAGQEYRILEWPVLLFAVGLAMLTGVIFGVLPATLIGRIPLTHVSRSQSGGPVAGRMRASFLGAQAAITLALLITSLTLGHTFLKLMNTDLGYQTRNVVTGTVSLQGTSYKSGKDQWRFYSDALERLRAIPGVEAAGAINYLPLVNNVYMAGSIKLDSGQAVERVVLNGVMPGYFQASGTALLAGRDFTESERQGSVIVNQEFAKQTGLEGSLVGRRLIAPWTETPYVITGVVATARLAGPAHAGGPQVYWPVQEEPPPALMFVAKVRGDVTPYVTLCRDTLRSLDRTVPVYDVKTLDERLEETLARPRFYVTAALFLSALAVILAVSGIYGSLSYSVAQRRHEIGVRMALGASPAGVRSLVMRQGLLPVAAGIGTGLFAALLSGEYLEHLMDGTAGPEPAMCAAAALLLIATAVGASWKATASLRSLDPIESLRAE